MQFCLIVPQTKRPGTFGRHSRPTLLLPLTGLAIIVVSLWSPFTAITVVFILKPT